MAFLSDTVIRGEGAASWRPRLRVERLAIRRGRALLVRDFSWTHPAGAIAWVVGPNGAGKSSLLRTLAGLDAPASGRVRLDAARSYGAGRALYYHPRMRPPRNATLASWTRWCAGLPRHRRGRPTPPVPRLAPTGLSPGHRLEHLSTGQAKRLLLEALLRRPGDFLVLDEPFAHLSPAAGARLGDALADRARSAVVVVATNSAPATALGPVLELRSDGAVRLASRGAS